MKRAAFLLPILVVAALACSKEQPVANTAPEDTREPIAMLYVGTPELNVLAQPQDGAATIATYQNGESVSVLSEKGEWAEIRTGEKSGWVHKADLVTAEQRNAAEAAPTPKFERMPMPVSAPSAKGEIYYEANVNSDGEITSVTVLENTTKSDALASQNAASLKAAKFYPIVVNGERKPFKYYHRVTY